MWKFFPTVFVPPYTKLVNFSNAIFPIPSKSPTLIRVYIFAFSAKSNAIYVGNFLVLFFWFFCHFALLIPNQVHTPEVKNHCLWGGLGETNHCYSVASTFMRFFRGNAEFRDFGAQNRVLRFAQNCNKLHPNQVLPPCIFQYSLHPPQIRPCAPHLTMLLGATPPTPPCRPQQLLETLPWFYWAIPMRSPGTIACTWLVHLGAKRRADSQ
jgi:hypothetical protein